MFDADAIETLNREQLVTATDRLLLRRGRLPKHRPGTAPFVPLARGSQPHIIVVPPAVRSTPPSGVRTAELGFERTAPARSTAGHAQILALGLAIPTLVGLALGLAALL